MKTRYIFLIFILILCHRIEAQNINALKRQLNYTAADTFRIRAYNIIADSFYFNYQFDSCERYSTLALNLSHKLFAKYGRASDKAIALQIKRLKAKSLENYGSSLIYENTSAAVDSVKKAVKLWLAIGDKEGLASVYQRLGEIFTNQNKYSDALKYLNASLDIYKGMKNKSGMAMLYYERALAQRYMANFGDALESNLIALSLSNEVKDSTFKLLCLLANGFIYMMVKDYSAALKSQNDALKLSINRSDSDYISNCYSDLGTTYKSMGKLDTALNYYTLSLRIREQSLTKMYISSNMLYIADILARQGKYNQALKMAFSSLENAQIYKDGRYILDSYTDIANYYLKMHEYSNALKYFNILFQESSKIKDRYSISRALQGKANAYLMLGNYTNALNNLNNALSLTDSHDYRNLKLIYADLSDVFEKKGDFKNAFYSNVQYKRFSDSVEVVEKALKITSLSSQLEYENKRALLKASQDKQLALQRAEINRQKLISNIFIAGLVLVLVLALILLIRFREKRKLNIRLEKMLSDLKSTQTQLIHSEKMASLGELTAGIAHEIQNPLNFVNNFSEVNKEMITEALEEIENGSLDEVKNILNEIQESAEKINFHGRRADAIVKSMLQHSRKSTGQKEMIDINALCDEYIRLSYHGLRAKDKSFNADFSTDFNPQILKIKIIGQDISRVLLNLFNNAFYACAERSRNAVNENQKTTGSDFKPLVSVKTSVLSGKIQIKVSDNGNGIPAELKEKIFQPFFTTKQSGEGTGLGLSLSYDIIKAHGGEILVESQVNEGTSFIIQLPMS